MNNVSSTCGLTYIWQCLFVAGRSISSCARFCSTTIGCAYFSDLFQAQIGQLSAIIWQKLNQTFFSSRSYMNNDCNVHVYRSPYAIVLRDLIMQSINLIYCLIRYSLDPRPHWRWAWYRLFAHAPHNPQKLGTLDNILYMLSKTMTSQRTEVDWFDCEGF